MRMCSFARLAVVTLLSICSVAQSPSSDPQSGSTTQPPTSPLQEPPKPTEADVAKPQAQKFDPGSASGEDKQIGELKLMTRSTELGGDTTRSFRVPGYNNLAEFNYFSDQAIFVNHRMQILTSFRTTDDRSIDPERVSLQKGYVRFFSDHDEFIFGDALVTLSRLTFNQNVKGAYANLKIGDDWRMMAFSGIFIDRYGSLYKDLLGRPFMAATTGLRAERGLFNRDTKFGFNFSTSQDQLFSLPALANGASPFPANNHVFSADFRGASKIGFRFDSEFAYSLTDFDSRFSSTGCLAPCDTRIPQNSLNGSQGDFGARFEASYRYKKLSLRSSFIRYQPNFSSANARQIADLQDFVFRASYDITNWLTADGTARRSNNDLKGQLPFQTTLWGPEGKFIFHDLPFYSRAIFEVGYRHRIVSSSDGIAIDRFVRIPYAEFTLPVRQMFFTVGYERRQAIDMVDQSQASNTDRVYGGIRGIFDIANWTINPTARYEFERQTHRPRSTQIPIPDFTLDHDNNRLASVALYIEAPKWFIMEGAFRSSSATLFGPVLLPTAPSGGSGFSRPSYKGAITYKFKNDENILFTFGFERYNNYYRSSNNYDERVVSGTIVYRFGKQAR
jgi:hypothetical protein